MKQTTRITLNNTVSLVWTGKSYPAFPYNRPSDIFNSLQRLFLSYGLDGDNPFRNYVSRGEMVLIKPNWVMDRNPLGYNTDSLVSHSSLVKYLVDFLARAMDGRGTIVVADAPLQSCDFNNLMRQTRMIEVAKIVKTCHPGIDFMIKDWRMTIMRGNVQSAVGNPNGTCRLVNLGADSFLEDVSNRSDRFRVTCYKPSLLKTHHAPGKHEYSVANDALNADFIINLAKMKTHIKAGLTGAMKNLVGINGHKEFLPHHAKGSYCDGGDSYRVPSRLKKAYEDIL